MVVDRILNKIFGVQLKFDTSGGGGQGVFLTFNIGGVKSFHSAATSDNFCICMSVERSYHTSYKGISNLNIIYFIKWITLDNLK